MPLQGPAGCEGLKPKSRDPIEALAPTAGLGARLEVRAATQAFLGLMGKSQLAHAVSTNLGVLFLRPLQFWIYIRGPDTLGNSHMFGAFHKQSLDCLGVPDIDIVEQIVVQAAKLKVPPKPEPITAHPMLGTSYNAKPAAGLQT